MKIRKHKILFAVALCAAVISSCKEDPVTPYPKDSSKTMLDRDSSNNLDTINLLSSKIAADDYGNMPTEWRSKVIAYVSNADHNETVSTMLRPGYFSMGTGSNLYSKNRLYRLALQEDGNLVLYRNSDHKALWASETTQSFQGGGYTLQFQSDGNMVLYMNTGNGTVRALWNSGTYVSNNTYVFGGYFILQNDGNMVMYYTAPYVGHAYTLKFRTNTGGGITSPNFGSLN